MIVLAVLPFLFPPRLLRILPFHRTRLQSYPSILSLHGTPPATPDSSSRASLVTPSSTLEAGPTSAATITSTPTSKVPIAGSPQTPSAATAAAAAATTASASISPNWGGTKAARPPVPTIRALSKGADSGAGSAAAGSSLASSTQSLQGSTSPPIVVKPTPLNTAPPKYEGHAHLISTGMSRASLDELQRARAKRMREASAAASAGNAGSDTPASANSSAAASPARPVNVVAAAVKSVRQRLAAVGLAHESAAEVVCYAALGFFLIFCEVQSPCPTYFSFLFFPFLFCTGFASTCCSIAGPCQVWRRIGWRQPCGNELCICRTIAARITCKLDRY